MKNAFTNQLNIYKKKQMLKTRSMYIKSIYFCSGWCWIRWL